jgi:hypothetical protein
MLERVKRELRYVKLCVGFTCIWGVVAFVLMEFTVWILRPIVPNAKRAFTSIGGIEAAFFLVFWAFYLALRHHPANFTMSDKQKTEALEWPRE